MRIFTLLLLCLVTAWPFCAQAQDTVVSLTAANYTQFDAGLPAWKFKAGDNLQWAAKDWNDSGWIRTSSVIANSAEAQRIGFQGKGWFRLSLHADSTIVNKPVLLRLLTNGAAEIYLDGKKLHGYGKILGNEKSEYEKPYLPAIFVFKDTGRHVLSLRYENLYYQEMLDGWRGNIGGFRMSFSEYYLYFLSQKISILFFSLFLLISGGIFFALFLSHLVMYFFHKDYGANLIFSLFNLGLGVFFVGIYLSGFLGSTKEQTILLPLCILAPACSCFMLSLLVNKLFSWSRIRMGVSALFLAVVTGVTLFADYHLGIMFLLLQLSYCILEATIMVIVAIRKKIPGSGILGFGILCAFILFAFLTISSMMGVMNFNGVAGIVVLVVCMLSIFSLPFSMSACLSWSFARVNRDLKVQLSRVEELSRKSLQQEQEKQFILENQKEELEKEVVVRTREVVQQKQQVEIEKKKSDDLLLNILPLEVAEELKENGATKARHFDHVSVLFTDFVNFTSVAERLQPEELIAELNVCFTAFDNIMEQYGLEKIKTIGDAYLAVSGLPVANERHAQHAVAAALDIVAFVEQRRAKDAQSFEIRVGINSGPLVAGIVGVKKFAYDIWGDTVNIASRMETNSEPGKINISEYTYGLVKEEFSCMHRGKLSAKNKGEMDMYFVSSKK